MTLLISQSYDNDMSTDYEKYLVRKPIYEAGAGTIQEGWGDSFITRPGKEEKQG